MGNGSQIVNNTFEGSSTGYRPNGMVVTGNNLQIVNNNFSDMPTGISLFGDDPYFGTYFGIASNVMLTANRFCHVDETIVVEPLVTGVKEHGTHIGCERVEHEHGAEEDHQHDGTREPNH